MRRATLLIALVALLASAAVALGGGAVGQPKRAIVTSHGLRAYTVVGSYCSSGSTPGGGAVGGCGDAAYPLHPKAVLPITPNSKLRVNLRKSAQKLSADFIRVHGDKFDTVGPALKTKPVPGHHRRVWRIELPANLQHANVVAMFADFKGGGDADFWAGVKPLDRWP